MKVWQTVQMGDILDISNTPDGIMLTPYLGANESFSS
jgi:hypothetical protein